MVLNENVSKKIIPVAGGKGGVGKSIFSTNLALSLARTGKKTIIIDMDLGGSNIHTLLGFRNNNIGIGNYLSNKRIQFEDLVIGTPYDNLYFIPGDVQVFGSVTLTFAQIKKLLKDIEALDADYIILDLGAGTTSTVLDFFLISNSGIIVSTPQNTSIANSHIFIKNFVFRFLQRVFDDHKDISVYLKKTYKENKPGKVKTIKEILVDLKSIDKEAASKTELFLSVLQPKIILNMIQDETDYTRAETLSNLVKQKYLINLECLGLIFYDKDVNQSIEEKRPFVLMNPESITAVQIERIAQKIYQSEEFPYMPYDLNSYKDSFELAMIESEYDFEEQRTLKDNFMKSDGNYDIETMLLIIENQQREIEELRAALQNGLLSYSRPNGTNN